MSSTRVKTDHHIQGNDLRGINLIFYGLIRRVEFSFPVTSIIFFHLCIATPVRANNCDLVVHEIASDIQNRVGARISRIITEKQISLSPFPNTKNLSFFFTGVDYRSLQPPSAKAADNLLNSNQLQLAYAKRIITNCQLYSSVSFVMDKTGWSNVFYLFPDGSVKARVCLADADTEERWGVGYCD